MPNPTVPAAATGLLSIPPFVFLLGDPAGLAATNMPDDCRPPGRRALERHIEACITLLDAIDGDPDLEDGHDLEDSHDREADMADREPSLGWPEAGVNGPTAHGMEDLELDVPTGFRRVRRDLAVERDAMAEANRDLRRVIERLSGAPPQPATITGPDGRLYAGRAL